MSKEDNGGPAFPHTTEVGDHGEYNLSSYPGMSIRDYFAAKAMQAIVIGNEADASYFMGIGVAKDAYLLADAMLEARRKES